MIEITQQNCARLDVSTDSNRDTDIMNSLKTKLQDILSYFDTTKRVVYYDYPVHQNVGDLLINYGTEQFLAENGINVWRRYSVHDLPSSIRGMDDDVVILCHGGGNLGDLYPCFQNGRERLLELYPRNPVVVLPQSIHFESETNLRYSIEKLRAHKNCHIFARDARSLDVLRRYGIQRSSLMPDMAHSLWGDLRPDHSVQIETQPMRFVRRDKESKQSESLQGAERTPKTCDWQDIVTKWTHRFSWRVARAIEAQGSMGIHTQKYWQWRPIQALAIRDAVRFFSRYNMIYTNRLHAMLLGLLLQRTVCAFDNSYGKLSSYRDSWLKGMSRLLWEPKN